MNICLNGIYRHEFGKYLTKIINDLQYNPVQILFRNPNNCFDNGFRKIQIKSDIYQTGANFN